MTEEQPPRTPPERIRITKLQEAQLQDLVRIEQTAADRYYELGFTAEHLKPRGEMDIAKLTRGHDVLVASADHHTAGYLAWADEAPGVAVITALMVDPAYQRFGIATKLLREMGEKALGHNIPQTVTVVYTNALWALTFLGVRGFAPVDQDIVPENVARWCQTRGCDLVEDGKTIWWRSTDDIGHIPGLPIPS